MFWLLCAQQRQPQELLPGAADNRGLSLLAPGGRSFLREFLLQRFEVEARALLHRGVIQEGLRVLGDRILDEDEAPELVGEPVIVRQRAGQPRALKGIEPEIDQDGPIDLDRATEPAAGLIDEPVLEVVDTHRAEGRLGEVEDLMALRRSLTRDQVYLVVAVEIDLVGAVAQRL